MPNNAVVNGAKNSTSFTIIQTNPLNTDTLGRQLSKLYHRTRHSQVRHTSCHTLAIARRREQPIRHAALLNA
jgi:hypothetical protein